MQSHVSQLDLDFALAGVTLEQCYSANIQTKVQRFQKYTNISYQVEEQISGHSDRALAQNFDAILAGIAIWAGDVMLARSCQAAYIRIDSPGS